MKIIDPHIHLFDIEKGEYHWLKPANPPLWPDKYKIYQTYSDASLQTQSSFEVLGYVHIEAGFDNQNGHKEMAHIEAHATIMHRSIGYIDITLDPVEFMIELGTQAKHNNAIGIRHILEDTEFPEKTTVLSILENTNSFTNLAFLESHNGIFELQCDISDRELLVNVFAFFQRLPKLQLVLNHAGFPPTALDPDGQLSTEFNDWLANIQLLAKLPKIAVKCSGFELINREYSAAHIKAVLSHCIECFGLQNVMLASNFPLCELSLSYERYWLQVFEVIASLESEQPTQFIDKNALCYDNAFRIYNFERALNR